MCWVLEENTGGRELADGRHVEGGVDVKGGKR
jgi:hypothetical protein